MTAKYFLLSLMFSTMMVAPAMAAEVVKEQPKTVAKPSDSVVAKKHETTPIDTWIMAENAMIDPLSTPDKESIFVLRGKHSIIRVIGVVERDVGTAVKACGKANPDMKQKMEDRFKQWQDAVHPVIATAKKNLKAEIEQQNMVDSDQFKKVLKLNDAAFEYGDKRTVKDPVSSAEACTLLLDSMNSTEDQMVTLLQETLLPPSVIKSRAEKAEKAKAARKSFSKDAQ